MYRSIESGLSTGAVGQIRPRLLRVWSSFRCTHHVGNLEIFERNEVVVVHELSAQLVSCVAPLILDFEMKSHDHFNLPSTTVRSALFGREFALGSSEVLLCLGAKVVAFLEFTVTRGNLVHDAEISHRNESNRLTGLNRGNPGVSPHLTRR